jgi:hypothetical protein
MVHVTLTKPILNQQHIIVELKRLVVVNREELSEQISKTLTLNADKAENKLRVLVVASSMNGEGKKLLVMKLEKSWKRKVIGKN